MKTTMEIAFRFTAPISGIYTAQMSKGLADSILRRALLDESLTPENR
jgi:hypothetical protein